MEYIKPESWFRVVCRPALPKDTPDVIELTNTIWEGHDYVPKVWDEWLMDPLGLLAVAEFGGRVVGLVKLTRQDSEEWWLEGLRVHPKFEGRRIASRLHDYLLDYWQRNCNGVLRLATASNRLQVQHLCERTGFRKIAELSLFGAPMLQDGEDEVCKDHFKLVEREEVSEALEFASQSPTMKWTAGLMNLGWQWASPSVRYIGDSIQRKRAWWWHGEHGLLFIGEDPESEEEVVPFIQVLGCPSDVTGELLLDCRRLVGILGYNRVDWVASLDLELQTILQGAGFQREWELSLYIYEKWGVGGMV